MSSCQGVPAPAALEEFVILFGLTLTQFVYGAYSVFLSRVLSLGINPLFLVFAGNLVTFVLLAPFSAALERKKWPKKASAWLMLQFVLIALGGVAFQALMLMGIEKTSPAMASAMPNLSPGFIFIIAACLRFEKVDIRCNYSRAKIAGTLMCLAGAIAMSFLQNSPATTPASPSPPAANDGDWTIGCIYLLSAVFILSCTVVLQAATMNDFPAPLSLCSITSVMGAFLTAAIQIVTERKIDVGSPAVGAGTVACIVLLASTATSGCIAFQTWCIKKRGPVLVSMFSPVGTVCAAILSALTLGQLVSMESVAGMLVMFAGLYLVLWAKKKEEEDDVEWRREFERWKSKTYSLTVPLRVVALRGSLPPAWLKEFVQVQGKRVKMTPEFRGSLESIIGDLSEASRTGQLEPKSAMAADVVSIGDSWLSYAISEGLIEPVEGVEGQDWFRNLSSKWKVYLRRNNKGEIDPCGSIWAAPYRWGCMVIAYKKSKLEKHNLAPIEDWEDLWRPELRGKIVMVDSPREVIGSVLKSMGASYNTNDINFQVIGGMSAVKEKLTMFQQQVRLFDSTHYLKAFGTTDAWIAVGWSSDVLPVAKRMPNVTVIVPRSGSSLWADLWAIPAATKRIPTDKIGGRIRGPSPLIHQWIEFCLQAARASHFQQGLLPGASPASLECPPTDGSQEISKGKPKLETNLISGVPPPEILGKCEFLEPLSEESLADYRLLITNMQRSGRSWISNAQHSLFSLMEKVGLNFFSR